MDAGMVAFGAAAVAVALIVATLVMRSRKRSGAKQTTQLRAGFGPEYTRSVKEQGRSHAEQDLLARQKGAQDFKARQLSPLEAAGYTERWTAAQSRFVDDPGAALTAASRLVAEVISARGYASTDFEESAKALSVDHPRAVQYYRDAHEVVERDQHNPASVDDLRSAMVQFHAVFTEMVEGSGSAPVHAI